MTGKWFPMNTKISSIVHSFGQVAKNERTLSLCYVYHVGRYARLEDVKCGKVPTEFYYGALENQLKGIDVHFLEFDLTVPPKLIGGFANYLAEFGVLPEKLDGSALERTWLSLKKIQDYDCIVATTSGIAFALSFWKALGFSCPPVVGIQCGILNNSYSYPKKILTAFFLKRMVSVLFGKAERKELLCLAPNADIRVSQFGVDKDFWVPAKTTVEKPYILAVGNDGRRDFDCLISAVSGLDIHCRILTKRKLPDWLPPNVEHISGDWHGGGVSDEDLRILYQGATCVVVPLIESKQPSGQSVTLQAMACGRPVVLTRTRGLWSQEMMQDGENVLLVAPGDVDELQTVLLRLQNQNEIAKRIGISARKIIEEHADIGLFAEGIRTACIDAVARTGKSKM